VDRALLIAIVSALVAVAGAALALFGQLRVARLQADVQERLAQRQAETQAQQALERYREPLVTAAHDLQSRLYNILDDGFLTWVGSPKEDAAVESTLFRLAQYFGWTEILRRDIQFLNFNEAEETRAVADLQAQVGRMFSTDRRTGGPFMIWWDEQRAIGERMIVEEHGKVLSMGYASFVENRDPALRRWLDPLEGPIRDRTAADSPRLAQVQNLLCDLVERLDAAGARYGKLKRASPRT
jgi:hypothetical protein